MPDGWPAALERGEAGRPLDGETRSGDVGVFAPVPGGGALVALIDGLGHGPAAADAAEAAAAVLRAAPEDPAPVLFERCHAALRRTRGAVMTLARFDLERGRLTWGGVGNVEARVLRADGRQDTALVLGGALGHTLPRVRPGTVAFSPGDAVVLATDGLDPGFYASLVPGEAAPAQAERLHGRHRKGTDDALVLVVRWVPSA